MWVMANKVCGGRSINWGVGLLFYVQRISVLNRQIHIAREDRIRSNYKTVKSI